MLQRSSRKMLVCGKRAIASGKLVWKNLPITTSQNPQESRIKLFQKVLKKLRVLSTKNQTVLPSSTVKILFMVSFGVAYPNPF